MNNEETKVITLVQRLEVGLYPKCPVSKLMKEKLMNCEKLVVYGLSSNYCPTCNSKGYDPKCELYLDYLGKKIIQENRR